VWYLTIFMIINTTVEVILNWQGWIHLTKDGMQYDYEPSCL